MVCGGGSNRCEPDSVLDDVRNNSNRARSLAPVCTFLFGALVTALALAGCGTAPSGTSGGTSGATGAGATTPATPTTPAAAGHSATASPASTVPAPPAGGPVPGGFAAASVTFVS